MAGASIEHEIAGGYQLDALLRGWAPQRAWHRARLDLVAHVLPPAIGSLVLDAAAGSGIVTWKFPEANIISTDEAHQVVHNDIELHGDRERQGQREQIDPCHQRHLRILPKDVTAAVPGIPERHLAVLVDAFYQRGMLKEDRIPVRDTEAGAAGEQRLSEVEADANIAGEGEPLRAVWPPYSHRRRFIRAR